MLKGKFILSVTAVLLAFSTTAFAQPPTTQPVSFLPKAPNTAELEKFDNYKVSLYSGLPQISIPIYTIKTPSFEIPITLEYHASGIKLAEYPSWVGAGWALNAGGAITRQLVGKPDEDPSSFFSDSIRKALDVDPYTGSSRFDDYDYLNFVNQKYRDFGADIFSYSIPGDESGKFFYSQDSGFGIVKIPYSPVKISGSPAAGNGFTIFNKKGIRYIYGREATEDGVTTGVFGYNIPVTNAWMLESISAPDRLDTVRFSYTTQHVLGPRERNDVWTINDLVTKQEGWNSAFNDCYFTGIQRIVYPYSAGYDYTTDISQAETFDALNQTITFNQGKIEFESDSANREDFGGASNHALHRIKIYASTPAGYKLNQVIVLYHGYFISGTDPNSKRLRLDSVEYQDPNGTRLNSYTFDYNTSVNLPDPSGSLSKDYWGYYNGRSNSSTVPQTVVNYKPDPSPPNYDITIGSTNPVGREPDESYMQANVLTAVHFPTGGYTEFEYETNRYLDDSSIARLAGGLRIKKMIAHDGATGVVHTNFYKYGAGESGYGRRNFFEPNLSYSDEQIYESWCYSEECDSHLPIASPDDLAYTKRVRNYFSNPTIGINSTDGIPVTYAQVTEYNGDTTGVHGKTEYVFTDDADNAVSAGSTVTTFPITKNYARGQLLLKKVYVKETGGNFRVVEKDSNTYNTISFPQKSMFGGILIRKNIVKEHLYDLFGLYIPHDAQESGDWTFNSLYYTTDDNYLSSSTKTIYNADDSTRAAVFTTLYDYGNVQHQQPTTVTTTDSKGVSVALETRYPADFIPLGDSLTGNAVLDSMLTQNMQVQPIETWQHRGVADLTTGGVITTYKQLPNGFLVMDQQKRLEIAHPVNDYQPASVVSGSFTPDSRYKTVITISAYDERGNPLEHYKENDVKESYLWDVSRQYPIAHIINASSSEIFHDNFESRGGWDSGVSAFDTTFFHTGITSARVANGTYTLQSALPITGVTVSLSQATNYHFSGWVFSDGPAAGLSLLMKRSGETGAYSYIETATTSTINKWTYLEGNVSVPADVVDIKLRIDNNSYGSVWFDDLRVHPSSAMMTTYTYEPLIGMTSQSDVNGNPTYYEYDQFNRLALVRNFNREIIKKICYNYYDQTEDCTPIIYHNAEQSASFTRNNCSVGFTGGTVTYTISANTYSSYISQEDADNQALTALAAGGQAYANANASCTYSCSCSGEDQKCINNACETGTKVYTTSVYDPGTGSWICYYHYEFSDNSWSDTYPEYNVGACTFE